MNSFEEALRIEGLGYSIGSKEILEDIFVAVRNGELVGLIGPNGSGKTTLLRHVYRALPPEAKTVFIQGRDIRTFSYRESAREVTVLRQEHGSDFPYTILEMVLMGRSPHRKFFESDTVEDKELALSALRRVGMSHAEDRAFGNLSGGEKQRVLMARSLAQEAEILLLDEPTNHLDVYYQWSLMGIIKGLGKTVLAVMHELNLACAFCDRIYALDGGRIVASGKPSEVCTKELLAKVFRIDADVMVGEGGFPHIFCKGALSADPEERSFDATCV